VLNGGDINNRQELFRYGFGGWEKTRTQTRHGYDGFFELHRHRIKRSFSLFALPSLGSIYTLCRVSSPDALSNVRWRYSLHILRKHRIHRRRAVSALLES